jgi:hypothetical protein
MKEQWLKGNSIKSKPTARATTRTKEQPEQQPQPHHSPLRVDGALDLDLHLLDAQRRKAEACAA